MIYVMWDITQFKSSIVEIVLRQVMRGLRQDTTTNKVKYLAEYTVLSTIVGDTILQKTLESQSIWFGENR